MEKTKASYTKRVIFRVKKILNVWLDFPEVLLEVAKSIWTTVSFTSAIVLFSIVTPVAIIACPLIELAHMWMEKSKAHKP